MKNVSGIKVIVVFIALHFSSKSLSQTADSAKPVTTFSGTIGVSTNGFSIIPVFSLNSPAAIINLSWRKKRFSFEPDVRLVPDASKGGVLLWLRYQLVDKKKFGLRVGTHPAFTLIRRPVTENGNTKDITEMLRFIAFEVVPSYQFTKDIGVSAVYLQGNALQSNGPQLTQVIFLNGSVANIKLIKDFGFAINPSVYFLYTDGNKGSYLAVTGILSHKKTPFSLQSSINQTFSSNVPGNESFMWNVTLNYSFRNDYKKVK